MQILQDEAREAAADTSNQALAEDYTPTGQFIRYPNKGCDYGNIDMCVVCREGGKLVCCDDCPTSFHSECLGYQSQKQCPRGKWKCYFCKVTKNGAAFTQRMAPAEEPCCKELTVPVLTWDEKAN